MTDSRLFESKEDEIQENVIRWAADAEPIYPCLRWLYHTPNGGSRNALEAKKLKRMGVKAGVSDLCLPYPSYGYNGLYIELKYGKNKPTEKQRDFLQFVENNGYKTDICYSSADAIKSILNYLDRTASCKG